MKMSLCVFHHSLDRSQSPLYGIIFMLLNTFALACIDIAVKILREDMHAGMVVFLYKFTLFLVILPWVLADGLEKLKTKRLPFHIMRSLFSVAGALCFYHGLRFVNMADAAALENLQYLLVAALGIIFFSEKLYAAKIFTMLLSFIGAFIVVNPGVVVDPSNIFNDASEYNHGHLFIILAISFWSCNTIIVKLLGNTEHNKTQMFYLLLTASILSIPPAFIQWDTLNVVGFDIPLIPTLLDLTNLNITMQSILLICFIAFDLHLLHLF